MANELTDKALERLRADAQRMVDLDSPVSDREWWVNLLHTTTELQKFRRTSKEPVGEVVAWGENIPDRQGVNRKVDFRWLNIDVTPGVKLYAAPCPAQEP